MAAPSVVQSASTFGYSVTYSSPVTAGNWVVLVVVGVVSTPTITDTAGNTYTLQTSATDAIGDQIYFFTSQIPTATSGLTINCDQGAWLAALEVKSVLDVDGVANGFDWVTSGPFGVGPSITTSSFAGSLMITAIFDEYSLALTNLTGDTIEQSVSVPFIAVSTQVVTAGLNESDWSVPDTDVGAVVIMALAGDNTIGLSGSGSGDTGAYSIGGHVGVGLLIPNSASGASAQGQTSDSVAALSISASVASGQGQTSSGLAFADSGASTGAYPIGGHVGIGLLYNQATATDASSQGQTTSAVAALSIAGTAASTQGQTTSAAAALSISATATSAQAQSTAGTGTVALTGTATSAQGQTTAGVASLTAAAITGAISSAQGQGTSGTATIEYSASVESLQGQTTVGVADVPQVQLPQPVPGGVGQGSLPGWVPYEAPADDFTEDDALMLVSCLLEVM